jgi:hypothetical protein
MGLLLSWYKVRGSKVQRFRVQGSKVQGSKVQGSRFKGSKVQGSEFRILGFADSGFFFQLVFSLSELI